MARKNRAKDDDAPAKPLIPPQLRLPLYAITAVLAISAGLGILWQVWLDYASDTLKPQMVELRGKLAEAIGSRSGELRSRMEKLVANPRMRADATAGRKDEVITALKQGWEALSNIEMHDASLDEAFSADAGAQGFGKLALLTSAINNGKAVIGVVGSGSNVKLGIAAPILEYPTPAGGSAKPRAVAYGLLPLKEISGPVEDTSLPGGYLELRSGTTVLTSRGDATLRSQAEITPASGGFSIASAVPKVVTTLPYPPGVQVVMALLALAVGGLMFRAVHKLQSSGGVSAGDEEEATFGSVLQKLESEKAEVPVVRVMEKKEKEKIEANLDPSIFRAYDIRGVVGKTLDASIARLIGQSIGSLMADSGLREIVVGRDGRHSGQELSEALIEGLRMAGRDVIDIGVAPTPVVYFGAHHLHAGSAVAVTGSHNPPDYNGFKIVVGGETLSGTAIQDLYARIADGRLDSISGGTVRSMDISADYVSQISGDIQIERQLKVVVDAGNGVAGPIGIQTLESIGAEVIPLYCDIDGDFPNHHPDPSEPDNLRDLIHFVQRTGADFGLAFDGDGDRLGVVTKQGEVIFPDRLLMLFAKDVLSRNPGATIIYDVKCTGHLAGQILRHGGSPIMWKTGHSLIKAKMKETDSELAGEMSGHFFFRERWFGFDDGIYSAARLLEILAADDRAPEEVFADLPKGVSTPEIKVPMEEGEHYAFIEQFVKRARFEGAKIATIDGIRADWPDGWGLVRCSNTTPCLVLRFDADDEAALQRIQDTFREQMLAQKPGLELGF